MTMFLSGFIISSNHRLRSHTSKTLILTPIPNPPNPRVLHTTKSKNTQKPKNQNQKPKKRRKKIKTLEIPRASFHRQNPQASLRTRSTVKNESRREILRVSKARLPFVFSDQISHTHSHTHAHPLALCVCFFFLFLTLERFVFLSLSRNAGRFIESSQVYGNGAFVRGSVDQA